jgi:ribonuclease BN (tRNA processing enzyme)
MGTGDPHRRVTMLLTCAGTGTTAPEPDRVCAGFLLEIDGLRILLDCGPGVVHSMARLHVPWQQLTHLVITHFHNDHVGDVPMLFHAWVWGMRPPRTEPLTVIGPHGTARLLHGMAALFGRHLSEPGFPFVVLEPAPGDSLYLNDTVLLQAGRAHHTEEALAFRFEADGRSFCYTGDTGYSDEVARFARGVDTLLTECSLPDEEAMDAHLTPSTLARLATAAQPGRLLVTHIYPQLRRDRVPQLVRAAGWNGAMELVHDGNRVEL